MKTVAVNPRKNLLNIFRKKKNLTAVIKKTIVLGERGGSNGKCEYKFNIDGE